MEQFRKEPGLSESKITTDDLGFTVQTVACLGACSLAPALTVNNKLCAIAPKPVDKILNKK
jgi:NADH-quinone oxidoreductase subunit E